MSVVQTTFAAVCVNPYDTPIPRVNSGRSGVIAPIAIAAGISGVRTNGSATTAWAGVNGIRPRRSAHECAGEGLLAATQHRHTSRQGALHGRGVVGHPLAVEAH